MLRSSMNKDYIVLGGARLRVEANWNALMAFLKEQGRDDVGGLSSLASIAPSEFASLMAACINEGERLDGRNAEYTALKVGEMCGIAEVGEFLAIYNRQTSPQLQPVEEKKD